jgi:hypothetical protein
MFQRLWSFHMQSQYIQSFAVVDLLQNMMASCTIVQETTFTPSPISQTVNTFGIKEKS